MEVHTVFARFMENCADDLFIGPSHVYPFVIFNSERQFVSNLIGINGQGNLLIRAK